MKLSITLVRGARFIALAFSYQFFLTENFPLRYSLIHAIIISHSSIDDRKYLLPVQEAQRILTSIVNTSVAFRQSRHLAFVKVI